MGVRVTGGASGYRLAFDGHLKLQFDGAAQSETFVTLAAHRLLQGHLLYLLDNGNENENNGL